MPLGKMKILREERKTGSRERRNTAASCAVGSDDSPALCVVG